MIFEGIIGHREVKKYLENAVLNDKVSHAYIFAGKRGVGKNTVANAFADELTEGNRQHTVFFGFGFVRHVFEYDCQAGHLFAHEVLH